jgi:hypothetical protein
MCVLAPLDSPQGILHNDKTRSFLLLASEEPFLSVGFPLDAPPLAVPFDMTEALASFTAEYRPFTNSLNLKLRMLLYGLRISLGCKNNVPLDILRALPFYDPSYVPVCF